MTTVAYDGKTLAADRMTVHSATKQRVRKLFDCGEYHYAACGTLEEAIRIAEWLSAGAKASERVTLEENKSCGIAVRKSDGQAFGLAGKPIVLVELRDPFVSDGSGHEYARAAMAMGKTAAQAVAFAARFDAFTGLGVDTWRFKASGKWRGR